MEKKKNIIIIVLLLIIVFLIGAIFGVLLKDKIKNETLPEEKEEIKEPTTDEVLSSIVGEWGYCTGEYNCRGLIISKNDGKYSFAPYIMWSEFGQAGSIDNVKKTKENTYELTVHYAGYSNEMGSSPESTNTYTIDLSDTSQIKINENTYQKVTGDRETFFNNLMK